MIERRRAPSKRIPSGNQPHDKESGASKPPF